ncbi:MAG: PHP domain-containing protein, partial [Pseudomonadota bacterium]|nr:PHP domain-containing protein [Pseudomonadota bacterium]
MNKAASNAMPAVAMTDQGNMFALVKFFRKAFEYGVKPLIGADLRVRNPDEPDRPFSLVLLSQDQTGYRNLTRLVSRSYLEGQTRGVAMIEPEWLDESRSKSLI